MDISNGWELVQFLVKSGLCYFLRGSCNCWHKKTQMCAPQQHFVGDTWTGRECTPVLTIQQTFPCTLSQPLVSVA